MMLIRSIIGDVNTKYLVKMVNARFWHYKVTIFSTVISK